MHENAVRKKLHRFTEETTLIPTHSHEVSGGAAGWRVSSGMPRGGWVAEEAA